jgi:hypothetical protein
MPYVALGAGYADVSQTRSASLRTRVNDVVTRVPYRCAVGLMTKTDEVSEQGCSVGVLCLSSELFV